MSDLYPTKGCGCEACHILREKSTMNQNDRNRFHCVNNQLCNALGAAFHRQPPKKRAAYQSLQALHDGDMELTKAQQAAIYAEMQGKSL